MIHSPLVGPVTWSWVADELERLGHRAVVPTLTTGAAAGDWRACVRLAVDQVGAHDELVLVGHSGAGPLLPLIAAELGTPSARLVFVDAAVPPRSGLAPLVPPMFLDHLRSVAVDGLVPRWSDLWGPEVMATMVPDEERRAPALEGQPQVPLSYFETAIPMPDGWSDAAHGAYLILSDAYREDADEAAA